MKTVSIRFTDEAYERIKQVADRADRSINAEVNRRLEKSLSDIEDIKQGKTQIDVSR